MEDQCGRVSQAGSSTDLTTQPPGCAFQTLLCSVAFVFISKDRVIHIGARRVGGHFDLGYRYSLKARVTDLRLQRIYQNGAYEFRDASNVLLAQLSRSLT
jgi:hypothetical protein